MDTWVWVLLVLMVVTVTVVAVRTGRRQRRTTGATAGNDRLGVKDPRDTPWGPPSSF